MDTVVNIASWVVDHWTMIAGVLGLFGVWKHVDRKKLERSAQIAGDVFWLVEEWAGKKKSPPSSDEKRERAEDEWKKLSATKKLPTGKGYLKAAQKMWSHLGWKEKVIRPNGIAGPPSLAKGMGP